jgi:hypothetical protein
VIRDPDQWIGSTVDGNGRKKRLCATPGCNVLQSDAVRWCLCLFCMKEELELELKLSRWE